MVCVWFIDRKMELRYWFFLKGFSGKFDSSEVETKFYSLVQENVSAGFERQYSKYFQQGTSISHFAFT